MPGRYHLLLMAETKAPEAYIGHEQVFSQPSGFAENLANDKPRLYSYLARVFLRGLINDLKSRNAIDENLEDVIAVYKPLRMVLLRHRP